MKMYDNGSNPLTPERILHIANHWPHQQHQINNVTVNIIKIMVASVLLLSESHNNIIIIIYKQNRLIWGFCFNICLVSHIQHATVVSYMQEHNCITEGRVSELCIWLLHNPVKGIIHFTIAT